MIDPALEVHFQRHLMRYSSPHTRRAYRLDWQRFCFECLNWMNLHMSQDILQQEEIYLAWLRLHESKDQDAGLTAREKQGRIETRSRILASLSSFLEYLKAKDLIAENPILQLKKLPKNLSPHARTEALTQEEMGRLLQFVTSRVQMLRSAPRELRGTPTKTQIRSAHLQEVVIWTLLTVGMRVGELCTLRLGDFQPAGEHFKLHLSVKGGDTHTPFVRPETAARIANYIREHRKGAPPESPLFVRAQRVKKGGEVRLTQYGIYTMVAKLCREAGIHKRISPHSLRASLATALIQQNVPLAHVKELLGHSSIQTTQVYVKRAQELEEAATLQLDVGKLLPHFEKTST